MIKQLKSKIFWLIQISLTAIILGIIILYTILSYRNTINSADRFIERVAGPETRQEGRPEKERDLLEINLEGVYSFQINNSKVISAQNASDNETLTEYAINLAKGEERSGIINNYVYKVRKFGENSYNVMLIEDESTITHLKIMIAFSIIVSTLSLVIIYIVAKQMSETIVKPVEETLEKQKQFISDASHELKTPLAVIEANADVLEQEVKENKWIKYIQNEVESMNKLVNNLLMLAKTENSENIKNYKQINVSKEVELNVAVFESMAYEKQVKIETNIQEEISMNGNSEDIKHIVSTLLDNAIKHTEPNNKVIVDLHKNKNDIVLQVKNQGSPIPEEERDKIFERFYRVDKSRNRNEKRYGLGLAIAKSIVEKYHGKISVNCEKGFTIFSVIIPY